MAGRSVDLGFINFDFSFLDWSMVGDTPLRCYDEGCWDWVLDRNILAESWTCWRGSWVRSNFGRLQDLGVG